jgi:hypothetical protein
MASDRRQRVLLAVLGAVLALTLAYRLWPAPAVSTQPASNGRGAGRAASSGNTVTAPDVHLDALQAERPKPGGTDRDLFRFKPKAPPPPPPPAAAGTGRGTPAPAMPGGPPPTAPPPPIPLKYFGVVSVQASGKKVAALSDGRAVWQGSEGDVILGQYKILRIGTESIELTYLDGRGRQTIRLSGS